MKLFRRYQKPQCCECQTNQNLLQWLSGCSVAHVCSFCAVQFSYFDFLHDLLG